MRVRERLVIPEASVYGFPGFISPIIFPSGSVNRIREPGKRTGRNRDRADHLLAAQCYGLVERSLHILNVHVEHGVMLRLVAERGDVTSDALRTAGLNIRRRAGLCDLPVEHLRIEITGLGAVAASDFKMNNWSSHGLFSPLTEQLWRCCRQQERRAACGQVS